ncbi:MAG: hypothetical protein KGK35_01180, partial [Xanthomonadaceae bacterium]|nr:hypothetical protein [Xanthomonadaceae bacterium]
MSEEHDVSFEAAVVESQGRGPVPVFVVHECVRSPEHPAIRRSGTIALKIESRDKDARPGVSAIQAVPATGESARQRSGTIAQTDTLPSALYARGVAEGRWQGDPAQR